MECDEDDYDEDEGGYWFDGNISQIPIMHRPLSSSLHPHKRLRDAPVGYDKLGLKQFLHVAPKGAFLLPKIK